MREYSTRDVITANIPYAAMVIIGALTIAYSYAFSFVAFAGAAAYFVYGVIGTFWIIIFVCPYCAFYQTRGCPCGYGMISSRIAKKRFENRFSEKFKRHIPVIIPLWVIPVLCGGAALWSSFSWELVCLVTVLVVESWIILPLVSKKKCCADCPQIDDCPWMARSATKKKPDTTT